MFSEIYMILIGIFAGIVTGLTGGSGVMVVVPLLNILIGVSVHTSIGISLIVDVVASIIVAYVYGEYGNIAVNPGIWMALGSIIGAQVGATTVKYVRGGLLGIIFGLSLIIIGYYMWRSGFRRERIVKMFRKRFHFRDSRKGLYLAVILGFIIGIITGFIGAGGGMMFFFVLVLILDYPIHLAVGTSTLIMAITASSGALGYAIHGNTNLFIASMVSIGAIIGGLGSAHFANKVNEDVLTKAIATVFIFLGVLMVIVKILG